MITLGICLLSLIYISEFIMQRNTKGYSSDFNRDWDDYVDGFGGIGNKTYWMGLREIYDVTKSRSFSLKVILKKNGQTKTIRWGSFRVDSGSNYRVQASSFQSGSSGLSEHLPGDGHRFTARNRDQDDRSSYNCARHYSSGGGWWFCNCASGFTNLNYGGSNGPKYYNDYYDESAMILER